jgi:hypothetical protein
MGTNMLVIRGSTQTGGVRGGAGSPPTLTWDDVDAIRDEARVAAGRAAAAHERPGGVGDGQNWSTSVKGTTPYFEIRARGRSPPARRSPRPTSPRARRWRCSADRRDNLFGPGSTRSAQIVRINNTPFEIVGVLEKQGPVGLRPGQRRRGHRPGHHRLASKLGRPQEVPVRQHLRQRHLARPPRWPRTHRGAAARPHQLRADADDDFTVNNLDRGGQRPRRGHRDDDVACSPASRWSASWSAASAS